MIKIGDMVKLLFQFTVNNKLYENDTNYGIVTKIDQPFYYVLWLQTSDQTRHYEAHLHLVSKS
jgi:alpha-mannosidase